METTVTLWIRRTDMSKFFGLLNTTTNEFPEKDQIERFFIDIFAKEMMGNEFVIVNIPLSTWLVFEAYKLIKY